MPTSQQDGNAGHRESERRALACVVPGPPSRHEQFVSEPFADSLELMAPFHCIARAQVSAGTLAIHAHGTARHAPRTQSFHPSTCLATTNAAETEPHST